MILSRALRELGFQVWEAGDGETALESLRRISPIDLAMVDWNMPGMDGLELLKKLRANPAYREVKIVMVTTESEAAQMSAALEAGANEYVMKPFTIDILLDKLRLAAVPIPV